MGIKDWNKDAWESSKNQTTFIKRKSQMFLMGKRKIKGYKVVGRVQITNMGNYVGVGIFKGNDKIRGSVKAFKTKTQALAFAKAHMRKN